MLVEEVQAPCFAALTSSLRVKGTAWPPPSSLGSSTSTPGPSLTIVMKSGISACWGRSMTIRDSAWKSDSEADSCNGAQRKAAGGEPTYVQHYSPRRGLNGTLKGALHRILGCRIRFTRGGVVCARMRYSCMLDGTSTCDGRSPTRVLGRGPV